MFAEDVGVVLLYRLSFARIAGILKTTIIKAFEKLHVKGGLETVTLLSGQGRGQII